MSKFNRHKDNREKFGKCSICLEYIPMEYYFNVGDIITCYGCGTEYTITSKSPLKISMLDACSDTDSYFDEIIFDDF